MSRRKPHDAEAYHHIFKEAVKELISPKRLVTNILSEKLKERGVDASKHNAKLEGLAESVLKSTTNSGQDGIHVEFEDETLGGRRIMLHLTGDDVDAAGKRLTDHIEESHLELFNTLVEGAVQRVLRKPDDRLLALSNERVAFLRRLQHEWRDAFRLLDILIALCSEIGDARNEWLRARRNRSKDMVIVDVITRLHARGLQVAQEVQVLLRAGFSDGALARWRTIHELSVTASFIASRGPTVATRFVDHLDIDSAKSARQLTSFASALGFRPIPKKELARLSRLELELKNRYGAPFLEDYGWAADTLQNKRPTFAAIEQAVDLDHLRPYFRLASNTVHAGAKGTYYRIGLTEQNEVILAGATNYGLEDPAQLVALSLAQLSTVLLSLHSNTDSIVWTRALSELADRVSKKFCAIGRRIRRADKKDRSPHI